MYPHSKKHLKEFDYLRGLAIIAVVIIHCTGSYWWKQSSDQLNILVLVNSSLNTLSAFAVPVFIFISGFILSYSYRKEVTIKNFYKKKFGYILPPYFAFSFLYLIYYLINGALSLQSDLVLIIFKLFTASMAYHLWFIALIIQFYLIFPYVIKLYSYFIKNKNLVLYLSLVISFTYSMSKIMIYYIMNNRNIAVDSYFYKIVNLFLDRIFLPYLFFFILGVYLSKNRHFFYKITKNVRVPMLFLVLVLSLVFRTHAYYIEQVEISQNFLFFGKISLIMSWYIVNSVSIILLYKTSLALLDIDNMVLKLLKEIGVYSFGIFLIHPFFLAIIASLLKRSGILTDSVFFYIFLFVLTMSFSYVSTVLISFLPFSRYIVGVNNSGSSVFSVLVPKNE
jgi:peptidoglycan/LPS O-acetylase OafA/YrhL